MVNYTRWVELAEKIFREEHHWPARISPNSVEWRTALLDAEDYLEEEANGNE